MDWISGIQRAIDYIEENLTEDIDYEEVAKKAYSSSFHFQRVFGILCGYTLGDYIRMRRLSLAAEELRNSDRKIIDVALKYGYDTPESFSRAFANFHGVTPTMAKRGAVVKSFSRLFVKLTLVGGNCMDYRIEKREPFKLVCLKTQVNKPQGDTATADISAFWAEFTKNGNAHKLMKYASFKKFNGILGVCFSGEMTKNSFPYAIGAEYNGEPIDEGDFEVVEVPAQTYAVFECKGKMPEAFTNVYKKICTEFLPQNTTYSYANGIEIEVYPSDDVLNPDYTCEIWIGVTEK